MSMNKDEASSALHDIEATGRRSRTLFSYSLASPYLLMWGVLWLIASVVSGRSVARTYRHRLVRAVDMVGLRRQRRPDG